MRWRIAVVTLPLACAAQAAPELRFSITEGRIQNEFYREGPIAAHLIAKSGAGARLVVAFPAGNSGIGLWFEDTPSWQIMSKIHPATVRLGDRAVRRGIVAELVSNANNLTVKRALLSNVRVLRDYGYANPIPASVEAQPRIAGNRIVWERRRIDGGPGYYLALEMLNGHVAINANGVVRLSSNAPLKLRLTALSGDPPLTPIPQSALLKPTAKADMQLRKALAFLSYDEKLLAGSWQYNSYFGRDTLMSLRLLMPILKPRPIEAGLGAVLARLDLDGQVAHEEDVGEFALLARIRAGQRLSDMPILDYKMVDDDFMLAPMVAHYLLATTEGRSRAITFLERRTPDGETYGAQLVRNLSFVAARARPFADKPIYRNLISLKDGMTVGQWRDSQQGLGGDGRYPYDVNVALVPAALQASSNLYASGLLQPYDKTPPADFATMATIWQREAPRLFAVTLLADEAEQRLSNFAKTLQWTKFNENRTVSFNAIALDAAGRPIPVMHSDEGFTLLLTLPSKTELKMALSQIMQPFPNGLISPVGMFVANPAFAEPNRYAIFDHTRYHGTVVWSWHQAMMLAGIERQLQRRDLPPDSRTLLLDARTKLRKAIVASKALRGSELWSWSAELGRMVVMPYGQGKKDETESNAVQLWSTAALTN